MQAVFRRRAMSIGAVGLAASLSLAACGGGSSTSNSGGANSAGSSGGQVTIGAILSMSGVYSTLGPPEQDAMKMSLEKINNSGGFEVNGKKYTLNLKVVDDQSQAASIGVASYRQLVDVDKVPVVILSTQTSTYQSAIKRSPLPVLNILDSTYPSILDVDKHVFLLRSDTPAYVPGAVYYAKNQLHASKIAFIGAGADPYSAGIKTWVKKAANEYGVQVVADVDYPAGTTNFAPFIQKAMASNPDAIYLGGVTGEILPVAKQLYESGIRNLPVLHNGGVTPNQAEQIIGSDIYNDVMKNNYDFAGTLPETSNNPATQQFFKDFQSRWNIYPSDLTMWAYDSMYVLTQAMQKAGTVSDRDKIYQAMLDMKVPPESLSGWIPADGGKLFHGRDAQTLEQGFTWCPDTKSLGLVFSYFMDGLKVTQDKVTTDGCKKS